MDRTNRPKAPFRSLVLWSIHAVPSDLGAGTIALLSRCARTTSPPFPPRFEPGVHVLDLVHFCDIVMHTVHNFSPPSPNLPKFGFSPQFGGF